MFPFNVNLLYSKKAKIAHCYVNGYVRSRGYSNIICRGGKKYCIYLVNELFIFPQKKIKKKERGTNAYNRERS